MSSSSTLSNHVLETYSDYHASGEVIPVNGCSQCKKKFFLISKWIILIEDQNVLQNGHKWLYNRLLRKRNVFVSPSVFVCEEGRQKPLCAHCSPQVFCVVAWILVVLSFQASDHTQSYSWTWISNLGKAIAFLLSSWFYLAPVHMIKWRFGNAGSVVWLCRQLS